MRNRHESSESSAEPDAIRSIFLLDILGELLEELTPVPEADPELMDGGEDGLISSPAQPAASTVVNAIIPAILAIRYLMGHSSVLK